MSGVDTAAYAAQLQAWSVMALERGREAWPELVVTEDELARIAALHLAGASDRAERQPLDAPEALDRLDAAELYLATACARGDALALLRFRRRYFDPLAPCLRRMGLGDAQRDDLWQTLCERLLVATESALPRIVRYAGGGELSGLVRIAATRVALNWRDREKRQASGDDWLEVLPAAGSDPELHFMKQRHRLELKEELQSALGTLSARERMVLRLHLVEQLGIDSIARVCSVHRATVARWIARSKETLAARVRDRLIARWQIDEGSLPAFKSLLDSQLDLSLERLLAAQ
jgi:RNA polymerase sigma-70 factor (ECF subfamily)